MIGRQSTFPPDFLILGAQKCGTTSLAAALGQHPDIFVPSTKEATHFGFVADDEVGGRSYRKFFSDWAGESVVGEGTPSYLTSLKSADQICRFLPEVKAIVQLRNPVDRAYSAYWHGVRSGHSRGTFADEIDAEFAEGLAHPEVFSSVVSVGHYAEQIQNYLDRGFDRQRMLVLLLDEFLADEMGTLRTVQEFLCVDPVITEFPQLNVARVSDLPRPLRRLLLRYWRKRIFNTQPVKRILLKTQRPFTPPPMEPEVRARLVDHYRPWNERLSELLGRDLPDWNR